jgi:hypothetical protein
MRKLPTGIYTHIDNGFVNVYTQKEFNKLYKHNVWWSKAKQTLGNVYTQKEFNRLYKHNVWWSKAKETLGL